MGGDNNYFAGITLSIAIICFVLGIYIRRKEVAPLNWPRVQGEIVSSKLQRLYIGHGREEVQPIIEYSFTYDNVLFLSSHWRFGNFSIGSSESANAVIERYTVGMLVTVFVNIKRPEKSVLEAGDSLLSWFVIALGAPFAVFAFALMMKR